MAEARLMKKLRHPNIIRLLETLPGKKSKPDCNCLVMEFCSGGDLRAYLRKPPSSSIDGRGGIGPGRTRDRTEDVIWLWFFQLCLGLHHMHQLCVLHRDVKTANVFLSNAGYLILGDLGIAREVKANEMASTVIGTPLYMAPEVLEGEPYTFASDIWSLGCVLYEICTGEPPFTAKSTPVLLNKICGGHFTPLPRAKFSARLQDLVAAMLRVNASERPTAAAILTGPAAHAHLKRYFHDRSASASSSNSASGCKADLLILAHQLQTLGVSVRAGAPSIADLALQSKGSLGGKLRVGEGEAAHFEAQLTAEREFERRQQLLAALDKLQRLRSQEASAISSSKSEDRDVTIRSRDANMSNANASPVSSCFSEAQETESEVRWRDPVQSRPRSSERRTSAQRPSLGDSSLTKPPSFLGVPRKGVPLTAHAKVFASRTGVCKDVRVLRRLERKKTAEAYKTQLDMAATTTTTPLRQAVARGRGQRTRIPLGQPPGDDEQQTAAAIGLSISELQAALNGLELQH